MNGRKAKALRMLAKYHPTAHRPALPKGGWIATVVSPITPGMPGGTVRRVMGTCVLPKTHPRHRYQFLKRQYRVVPLAHTLKRMHVSTRMMEAAPDGVRPQAAG